MRSTSKWTVVCLLASAIVLLSASFLRVRAEDNDPNSEESKIRRGFEIAPVPLNLAGKNRALVGLGSYLVNGVNDCNACHNGGSFPDFEYVPGNNPYNGQPKKFNPAVYLAGGQDFGPVGPPPSPDIITRNLTPDKTGLPEGGHTFSEFMQIMRTGKDFDHLHPNCSASVTTNCIPAFTGIDGDLLQIMPWPYYQSMTDHDLRAIYEYLSAIPCIEGPPAPSPLHNDCK
jgi:hypothetical protein